VQSLSDVEKEVDSLTDLMGEPIDKNIKHIVIALRYAGFHTTASCEGHMDRGFPYPWVDIRYDDGKIRKIEKKRLKKLLQRFYRTRTSLHPLLLQNFADFRLQNVKWPRTARGRRKHVDIPSRHLLIDYRREMDNFADYLISTAKDKD
jgi:hypothetical protein